MKAGASAGCRPSSTLLSPPHRSPPAAHLSEGAGPSWLHQESTVQDVRVVPEAGVADVTAIISNSAYGRFRKLFPQ